MVPAANETFGFLRYTPEPMQQHSGMTEDEILKSLIEKAEKRFGKERAEQLRPDLEQTAAELVKVYRQPLGFEDEP